MSSNPPMCSLSGLATARGLAAGPAFVYRQGEIAIPEYAIVPERADDERLRLKRALTEAKRDLETLIAALRERTGQDDVKVFECHLMLLEDEVLFGEVEQRIREERINAEAALRRTLLHMRERFGQMNDAYFRERIRDIDDVERRVQEVMAGFGGKSPLAELKVPSIVVADDLTPSETMKMPRELLLGFATNRGSVTSHVALLARAMGIPAVTGLGDVTERVNAGETVLLDGTNGAITLHPDEKTVRDFQVQVESQRELAEEALRGTPAGTLKNGGEVRLYANVHPGLPADGVKANGARGVGLYRSEYLWLDRELEPTEEEQFEAYRRAVKFAMTLDPEATIVIRTLDIGGDKTVRGISSHEANPFLGNRSIRYLLANREVFKTQLRAILRASAFGRVGIMYPMVSCVEELREAAKLLESVRRKLDDEGVAYDRAVKVGAMIEVPSAAVIADAMARYVDFFSLGTNDLVQYAMAADRGNEAVANLQQPTSPAVIKLVRMTLAAAKRKGIPVSVCGESASDPVVGTLWAAMGVDVLSMSPTYIPVISKILSQLTREDLEDYRATVENAGEDVSGEEMMAICQAWMEAKIPDFGKIAL